MNTARDKKRKTAATRELDEFAEIASRLAESEAELLELTEYFIEHREQLGREEREKLTEEADKLVGHLSGANGRLLEELRSLRRRIELRQLKRR